MTSKVGPRYEKPPYPKVGVAPRLLWNECELEAIVKVLGGALA
ncbi:hypothetical protein [Mastigocladopsis repens]|nr:hypothetical protein [Mastigocladopsis repens]